MHYKNSHVIQLLRLSGIKICSILNPIIETKVHFTKMKFHIKWFPVSAQKYLGNYYEDKFFEYGLIIIKPEALIMGKVDEIFSIFCTRGYELVYFTRKKIDAMCTAEMWKFSWQNATLENILINQKLLSMYDSIILILRLHNPGSKSVCEMVNGSERLRS